MSEEDKKTNQSETSEQAQPAKKPSKDPPAETKSSVRKGSLIVLLLIVLSLAWYLLADRYTPYTSQARVQGYVVGVAPEVSGVVASVWVSNNQEVEEGQTLFQIDPSQYEIALQKARLDLESAGRQVSAGSASVDAARANLLAAQANAKKAENDYARQQRLREEDPGTISIRRLEASKSTMDQTRARVTAAEADIQRAIEQKGGDDDKSNSILKTAQSAVEKAELDLANTSVTASSKGLVTDLRADIGQFAGAGKPVLTLISMQDVWINAEFTENNLGHMKAGSRVEILFDVLPGKVFAGEVRSIGLGVSAGQAPPAGTLPSIQNNRDWLRQSQRFPVVIEFNPASGDALRGQLRVGGQATVIAYTDEHGFLNFLGKVYIRLMSFFSYAY